MSLINVGICGASGKMGKALVRAVVNNNKLQLSSALEHDSNTNIGKDSGTIANIEPTGVNIISNADKFHRETYFVSVHTRNLAIPQVAVASSGQSIGVGTGYNK